MLDQNAVSKLTATFRELADTARNLGQTGAAACYEDAAMKLEAALAENEVTDAD